MPAPANLYSLYLHQGKIIFNLPQPLTGTLHWISSISFLFGKLNELFPQLQKRQVRRFSETQLIQKEKITKSAKKESASLNDISEGGREEGQETKQELLQKKSSERKKELRFDEVIHDLQSDALRICNEKQKDCRGSTAETWKMLEEEISDVKLLIETYHEKGASNKQTRTTATKLQRCPSSVTVSSSSGISKSRIYPMAGAVLGSCIGAPVAILAGIKIGGLATLSGIIFGERILTEW